MKHGKQRDDLDVCTGLCGQSQAIFQNSRPVRNTVVTAKRQFPFRWTFYIGKDGKILKVDRKVKAATDGETAAATLKALGVEAAK